MKEKTSTNNPSSTRDSRRNPHKLRYELQSVRDKSFRNRLRQMVRHGFGVCEAESFTLVAGCLDYLRTTRTEDREPLNVIVDLPAGRDLRFKVAADQVERRPVSLSPCAEHDLDLWIEHGMQPVQSARAVRLVEQADRAGCTMPLGQLVSLVHLGARAITGRLAPLWKRGIHLPLLGISASTSGSDSRIAAVLRVQLEKQICDKTRQQLLLAPAALGQVLRQATWIVKGYAAGQTSDELARECKEIDFSISRWSHSAGTML